MGLFNKIDDSAYRVQSMADRLGVDLGPAVMSEDSAYHFRSMVLACSCCTEKGACDRLRAKHETLTEAPSYCRNKQVFEGQS